jgi:hypothetical protein
MTTTSTAPAPNSRLLVTQLQLLMLTMSLLSIGLLLALAGDRSAPGTTLGQLRSSWFSTLADSRDASACDSEHSTACRIWDRTLRMARS